MNKLSSGFEDRGAQPLNGGSAAQSSALHVFDAFLGVVHDGDEGDYLQTQWDYMPPEHRNFIKWVRKRAIQLIPTIQQAAEYQKTIETLKHFRCEHIKVVTSYIVVPSSANKPGVGTGGTSFMKLLKKIRDDCLSH
ncbi:unnamed protein product [Anisakis simplex]|uniref:Uncharacterized protein n=1 Tax=Anisakis simplex TaxID=6269 RepID=A0A3P6SZ10_ANISI|nr:unnamed protein product [Anisakis simplex]